MVNFNAKLTQVLRNQNHTRNVLALVDVPARLSIRHQLVAGVALALVAVLGVDALVAALVILDAGALVDAAVEGLVGPVGAVRHLVAHEVVPDALLHSVGDGIVALELEFAAGAVVS